MNLTLFFRLILMSIFQKQVTHNKSNYGDAMKYDNQSFFCPNVFAKDGFNLSLQIHNSNYCSSDKGYRTFSHTMIEVEFGFPSMNEEDMWEYSEMYSYNSIKEAKEADFNITNNVGSIPIAILETVFNKHGGIDWEKTISIEKFDRLTNPSQ